MKNNKWLFIFSISILSFCAAGQTSQKSNSAVFEYMSALYYSDTQATIIDCRNDKGELLQFVYSKQDALKTEEILFNKPAGVAHEPVIIVTKTQLVGKKFNLTYNSIGAADPANPACCYKITGLIAL